MRFESFDHK